jgi:hypothetical protein
MNDVVLEGMWISELEALLRWHGSEISRETSRSNMAAHVKRATAIHAKIEEWKNGST